MSRIKKCKKTIKVKDWQQADEFLKEIGTIQSLITHFENNTKARIEKIKEALVADCAPRQERVQLLLDSLEEFANEHETDFGNKRSRELNFGILGWRKSTSISIKKNTLEKIYEVFGKVKAAIYIRTKETVDKESLAKLTDDQLASVGARRESTDVFFIEPTILEAKDYGSDNK